jgi:hypothetical protein
MADQKEAAAAEQEGRTRKNRKAGGQQPGRYRNYQS